MSATFARNARETHRHGSAARGQGLPHSRRAHLWEASPTDRSASHRLYLATAPRRQSSLTPTRVDPFPCGMTHTSYWKGAAPIARATWRQDALSESPPTAEPVPAAGEVVFPGDYPRSTSLVSPATSSSDRTSA